MAANPEAKDRRLCLELDFFCAWWASPRLLLSASGAAEVVALTSGPVLFCRASEKLSGADGAVSELNDLAESAAGLKGCGSSPNCVPALDLCVLVVDFGSLLCASSAAVCGSPESMCKNLRILLNTSPTA